MRARALLLAYLMCRAHGRRRHGYLYEGHHRSQNEDGNAPHSGLLFDSTQLRFSNKVAAHKVLTTLASLLLVSNPWTAWQAGACNLAVHSTRRYLSSAARKTAFLDPLPLGRGSRAPLPLALLKEANPATWAPDSFKELGVKSPQLCKSLKKMKFYQPMEAQYKAWPLLRDTSKDVALIAEAGSGKTLAYLVPLIDKLLDDLKKGRHVLYVVVPTHDLERQVMRVAKGLCAGLDVELALAKNATAARSANVVVGTVNSSAALLCKGGAGQGKQEVSKAKHKVPNKLRARMKGPDFHRRRTPGKADTMESDEPEVETAARAPRRPPLGRTIVMDEADFMLAGAKTTGKKATAASRILDELRSKSKAPEKGAVVPRVIFVSATVPGQSKSSVGSWMNLRFPALKWIRSDGAHKPISRLKSEFLMVESKKDRDEALLRLCKSRPGRTMVFANTVGSAKNAHYALTHKVLGLKDADNVFLFHPDVTEELRDQQLDRFVKSDKGVLVCSGLGARGIDLPDVKLVIEFQMAPHMIEHMHRLGRTARAGKAGHAITFVSEERENEMTMLEEIKRCRSGGYKFA